MTMSNFIYVLTQPDLLAWLLKATALLVLALGATTLLRRASAGTRHLVWLATLAGILLLPAVSMWTPIRLAIVPARLMPSLPQLSAPPTAPPAAATPSSPAIDVAPPTATPVVSTQARPAPSAPLAPALPNEPPFPTWTTLLLAWAAAATVLLGWLAFGALSVRRIVKTGRVLDERAWTAPLCEIADRLDLDSVPRLLSSPLIEMPFACGVVQPTIVLPASAEEWSDSRRRAVLFHELAHVKRRDLVGHTLGRIACALYWFHPLVWTAGRRLRAESERACDDLVLSCGARASDYADHLLDIVISVRHHGAPATAMPMARRRELEGRVLAILDPAVARIGPGRLQSAALVAGIGVLALSVAAMAPARRAIRDTPPLAMRATPESTVTRLVTREHNEKKTLELTRMVATSAARDGYPTPTPFPQPTPQPSPKPFFAAESSTSKPGAGAGASSLLSDAVSNITNVAVRSAAAAISGIVNGQGKQVDSAKVALLLKVLRSDP